MSLKSRKKRNFNSGFSLIELLVAVTLSVTVLSGVMMAYTASIRYMNNVRDKQLASSNAMMAMKLIEKELYSAACTVTTPATTCDGPGDILAEPDVGEDPPTKRINGFVRLPGSTREFCICYQGSTKTIRYKSGTSISCFSSCTGGAWLTIARNIEDMDVTRPNNSTVEVRIKAKEGMQGAATLTRDFYTSVAIAYSN